MKAMSRKEVLTCWFWSVINYGQMARFRVWQSIQCLRLACHWENLDHVVSHCRTVSLLLVFLGFREDYIPQRFGWLMSEDFYGGMLDWQRVCCLMYTSLGCVLRCLRFLNCWGMSLGWSDQVDSWSTRTIEKLRDAMDCRGSRSGNRISKYLAISTFRFSWHKMSIPANYFHLFRSLKAV